MTGFFYFFPFCDFFVVLILLGLFIVVAFGIYKRSRIIFHDVTRNHTN